ncbi:DUF1682-domain-containing protein [Westerdykella ornata]|uniref:DUF1682-domain-containing protein n=1 Tax=Westerdykella ornata TaxID=318751 RepID=A0A6A6J7K4_WESOR|nr:DUF1682-domain-containing protein [Westerdykella ornata]KAF2272375.1 DUF1682-domain-containing protein [Westerdykella ornata]
MADFVKGIFGGQKPAAAPASAGGDDDFADYAGAPEPEPTPISAIPSADSIPSAAPTPPAVGAVPYTKWYRVWERTTLDDFKMEMYVLPFIFVIIAVHLFGTRKNRRKARQWVSVHAPVLRQEFAQVGYSRPKGDVEAEELDFDRLLREKKVDEYLTYATGRQNVAFVDFKLTLLKRYNPLMRWGEVLIGLFFESLPAPEERMEATAYAFDGQESKIVPGLGKGEDKKSVSNSTYDGFVFAVVHKDLMKRLREERYDLSLTSTKDHPKLPIWTTVMSESAEVTEKLLTPELVKAINDAGDRFEALVITDQPMDQPKKLDETTPRKRLNLSLKLPSSSSPSAYDSTLPLFTLFLRLPDFLVSSAHFRPEALRRIKQTREDQIAKIRKIEEEEKAEERKLQGDRAKKEKREQLLSRMSAEEQRKYLEKERERDLKRKEKRKTVKA